MHQPQRSLKIWKADASGTTKQSDQEASLKCDVGSELEVLNALKRRGVAYELAHLMSFETHEEIINLLYGKLQREPLEGFRKPTLSQLSAADREIHLKLAELTRAGLPLGPSGELPLDKLPSVMWLLMPRPKSASSEKTSSAPSNPQPKKVANSPDKKFPPKNGKFDKNNKRKKMPMPVQLRGTMTRHIDLRTFWTRNVLKSKTMQLSSRCHLKSAKAEQLNFPEVDVIQDRPVSLEVPAEELDHHLSQQSGGAATFSGTDPGHEVLVEEPKAAVAGEKDASIPA